MSTVAIDQYQAALLRNNLMAMSQLARPEDKQVYEFDIKVLDMVLDGTTNVHYNWTMH